MHNLWIKKNRIPESKRIALYSALVLPILPYNCETRGVAQSVLTRLDVFHRKQLLRLLGLYYPARVTNDQLYKRARSSPLSITIQQRRIRMMGHVLRLDSDTPPQKSMLQYFSTDAKGRRGRPKLTLATTSIQDQQKNGIKMKNTEEVG